MSMAPSFLVSLEDLNRRVPSEKRSPSSFMLAFHMRIPTFNTAEAPPANAAGATQAQLTSSPSKGASSVSDHRRSRFRSVSGNRLSHAARSGVLRQFSMSRPGALTPCITGPFQGTYLRSSRADFSKQKRHLLQSLAAAASMQSKLQRSIRRQMIGADPHVQGT